VLGSTTVVCGNLVQVQVTNGPGQRLDWIGLYGVGARDLDHLGWKYLNGAVYPPAAGITEATVTFRMPRFPGTYNFRFFRNGTHQQLATSATVEVVVVK
jgi:hypothetical protein